jgi:FlaA1/EpsC-like NDP-sugar epimerase
LYNIIGFVDDSKRLQGKFIEGTPVRGMEAIENWVKNKEIDTVIIAIKNPKKENKSRVVDLCLDLNVAILTVPPLDQWLNGGFTSKQIQKIKIEDLLGRKEIELNSENINSYASGKVVLITGAAGSIGSEISRQLLHYNPEKVILLDQAESPLYDLNVELGAAFSDKKHNWEVVIADVSNEKRMARVFDHYKPQVVFHAAAYKHVPLMEDNPSEAIHTNVKGTKVLADLANQFAVEQIAIAFLIWSILLLYTLAIPSTGFAKNE